MGLEAAGQVTELLGDQGQALGPKTIDPQGEKSWGLIPGFSVLKPKSPTTAFNTCSKLLPTANSFPCLVSTQVWAMLPGPTRWPQERTEAGCQLLPPIMLLPLPWGTDHTGLAQCLRPRAHTEAEREVGSGGLTPGFESTPCYLMAVSFGTNDITSLSLTFFICQMGIVKTNHQLSPKC